MNAVVRSSLVQGDIQIMIRTGISSFPGPSAFWLHWNLAIFLTLWPSGNHPFWSAAMACPPWLRRSVGGNRRFLRARSAWTTPSLLIWATSLVRVTLRSNPKRWLRHRTPYLSSSALYNPVAADAGGMSGLRCPL